MINWEDIDLKGKTSGQHKFKCPICLNDKNRGNPKDTSLSVNISEGLAKCHKCENVSIRDKDEPMQKEYKLPSQNWKNYTTLSDKVIKYYEETRKISQSTLINCRVTEEKHYQPSLGKEVTNIVYNYFEGEKLVNKKYRSGAKKFTQSAGTKNIFYGINDIIGEKEAWIVEGEEDKHALYEIGIKNAISVPNGANDNDDVWENSKKYLEGVERFYIAVDNDTKGNELSEKISRRLGRWKCLKVEFKNKDANDDLIEGRGVLENSVKNAKRFPVSGTFTTSDLKSRMLDLYDKGLPDKFYPKHHSFGNLKNIFSVMRGHLIVPTGIPSHGKSNFTEWYVMNLVNDYNLKSSFFSPEHMPLELHMSTFCSKYWAKPYFKIKDYDRLTKDEVSEYIDWADEKIYLTSPDNGEFATWDWLFEKFKEQMYSYGIDIFVIDAFNKVGFNKSGNRLEQINDVLGKLTSFAQMNDVMVFLVAHPTKMKKNDQGIYDCPSLYDVSGSADFRNQTHDGYAIYRHFGDEEFTEFINLKTKLSFQGEINGKVEFEYHLPSGRYYERFSEPYTAPLSDFNKEGDTYEPKEEHKEKPIPKLTAVEAFEDNDNCPF